MTPRCFWCNGNLGNECRCIHCGRSQDPEHEEYVHKEQLKKHKNWHGNNPPEWKRGKRKTKRFLNEKLR